MGVLKVFMLLDNFLELSSAAVLILGSSNMRSSKVRSSDVGDITYDDISCCASAKIFSSIISSFATYSLFAANSWFISLSWREKINIMSEHLVYMIE